MLTDLFTFLLTYILSYLQTRTLMSVAHYHRHYSVSCLIWPYLVYLAPRTMSYTSWPCRWPYRWCLLSCNWSRNFSANSAVWLMLFCYWLQKTFTEDARPKSRLPAASSQDREKAGVRKRSLTIATVPPSTTTATNEPITYMREQSLSCDLPVSTVSCKPAFLVYT